MNWNLWVLAILLLAGAKAFGRIERVWLTHRSNTPQRIVINWETTEPGNSVVRWGATAAYGKTASIEEKVKLHRVEIPLEQGVALYHYCVSTGGERSADATFKGYPADVLRVAVVADWQGKPNLDAIARDDVHLLMTAGDNIDCLHKLCGAGVKDCTKPYAALIDRYPEIFRSIPFMPALGNHDREIRPRGSKPPAEAVYDVEATAFRTMFALPDEGWKWRFDVPALGVRFITLDLNHISDMGTTWQTCHPFDRQAEQFQWYERLMTGEKPPFVVTLQNEKNENIRHKENKAWHGLFSRGTAVISGFGYFAERAEVDGFSYYNTSLSGKGAKYPDSKSAFFRSEDSYVLITVTREPRRMKIELKTLGGETMDVRKFAAK